MSENQTIDNYKMKVFLYKYTPTFTKVGNSSPTTASFPQVDKFVVELNESKYFSKYDITDLISSYSFSQDLSENTYSWSVIMQNVFLTFNELNTNFLVEGQRLGSNNLTNLAQYEASSNDITNVTNIIVQAKKNRGTTPDSMSIQAGAILPVKKGLKISDLIQPYDVISVFLYRGKAPITELTGTRIKDPATGRITFNIDQSGLYHLTAGDLRLESVLLSPDPDDEDITLFSNEFNGFIMVKSVSSEVGSVETVNISGNGISRLFGATRRVVKQGVLQSSLYDIALSDTPEEYTAYTTNYADKTMVRVFLDFFKSIYGIRFAVEIDTGNSSAAKIFETVVPDSSFYDISVIMLGNQFTTNLFTIPPFLLSLVMKRHGFAYRAPLDQTSLATLTDQIRTEQKNPTVLVSKFHIDPVTNQIVTNQIEKSGSATVLDQNFIDTTIADNLSLQTVRGTRHPINFSEEINTLRGYFLFFADVLKGYAPDLKTPFEIIDEIKEKSFIEFFEQPNGEFQIRAPQYNNTESTLNSLTLNIINTNYIETSTNLVTLQKVAYVADIINEVFENSFYSFMDGKLFLQYGFIEAAADSNPNAANNKTTRDEFTQQRRSGLIRYAQYLLRLHNASLRTGTVVMGYDQRVIVGKTFFDAKNNKFGYITGVSKAINTGGTATITVNLSYVRDCYFNNKVPAGVSAFNFEHLDTLTELAQQFQESEI
jgi:hypothetical protein